MKIQQKRIAIFASGGGSNALKIIQHFENSETGKVVLVVSNKPDAGVLKIAAAHDVPSLVITRNSFYNSKAIIEALSVQKVDFIALAGFLWLAPAYLIEAYPNRIVNIHPALLPKYGGKGMYGIHVHRAVKEMGELASGMTIHYVNSHYDEGGIIFQDRVPIAPEDTPEVIAQKVLKLEHEHYPIVIEQLLQSLPIE